MTKDKLGAKMLYEDDERYIYSTKNNNVSLSDCMAVTKPLCHCNKCISKYLEEVNPVELSNYKAIVVEPYYNKYKIDNRYNIDIDGNVVSGVMAKNNTELSKLIDTKDLFVMGDNHWAMIRGVVSKFKPNSLDWELKYDKLYLSNGDVYKLSETNCGEFSSYNSDFYGYNLVYSLEVMLNSLIKIL